MKLAVDLFSGLRPDPGDGRTIVSLRWFLSAGFGIGVQSYALYRVVGGVEELIVQGLGAPGAEPAGSGWTIDAGKLAQAAAHRQADGLGPIFSPGPSNDSLAALLLYALTSPDAATLDASLETVVAALGSPHTDDAVLAARFWPGEAAPDLPTLKLWRTGTRVDRARYRAVRRSYRRRARQQLGAFSLDFGFARFLGTGWNDEVPGGVTHGLGYRLEVTTGTGAVSARTDVVPQVIALDRPRDIGAEPTVGRIGHPMFEGFLGPHGTWRAPTWAAAGALGKAYRAADIGRYSTALVARIRWKRARFDGDGYRQRLRMTPFTWQVERLEFGPSSVGEPQPVDDQGLTFAVCQAESRIVAGWPQRRSEDDGRDFPSDDAETSFLDDPDRPFGMPAMLGWYAYRVRAIDMFGIRGRPSDPFTGNAEALVHLDDEFSPAPPGLTVAQPRIELEQGGAMVTVPVNVEWFDAPEFTSPDARHFRITAAWRQLVTRAVVIVDTRPADKEKAPVHTDLKLQDPISGAFLDHAALAEHLGGRINTSTLGFTILRDTPQIGFSIRVRANGHSIDAGQAILRRTPLAPVSVSESIIQRAPSCAVVITATSTEPPAVTLVPSQSVDPVPSAPTNLYVHLFGGAFTAIPDGAGGFVLEPGPATNAGAAAALTAWRALPSEQAKSDLSGSPGLALPLQTAELELDVPPGFGAGIVDLRVSAIDAASWRWPAAVKGNEGLCSTPVSVPVISEIAPLAAAPARHIWARDAAPFDSEAVVDLTWDSVEGAARWEVERVFAGRLGLKESLEDRKLLDAAVAAPDGVFERRTNAAFAPCWQDRLPGRAPDQAVYRVRAVSRSEIAGEWGGYCIVSIPDTRIPPVPNLLSVRPGRDERTIDLLWSQAGPPDGIGFEIEQRRWMPDSTADAGWTRVADYLPGTLLAGFGSQFGVTLIGQVPGVVSELRVTAVRHAPDPIDPRRRLLRRIRGPASRTGRAAAGGELRAPERLTAHVANGYLQLRWRNTDPYDALEVQLRRPGGVGFVREHLPAVVESLSRPAPADKGTWAVRILATGAGRSSVSDPAEVEV